MCWSYNDWFFFVLTPCITYYYFMCNKLSILNKSAGQKRAETNVGISYIWRMSLKKRQVIKSISVVFRHRTRIEKYSDSITQSEKKTKNIAFRCIHHESFNIFFEYTNSDIEFNKLYAISFSIWPRSPVLIVTSHGFSIARADRLPAWCIYYIVHCI